MTNKQKTIDKYWQISADFMQSIVDSGQRIELHHIDPELKAKDPKRHAQFNVEDVVPIGQKDHLKLHKYGHPHTKEHNIKIGKSVRKTRKFKGKLIKVVFPDGKVYYAITGSDAARAIGCTKQLVYQVFSRKPAFRHFKTAHGCKLSLVKKVGD